MANLPPYMPPAGGGTQLPSVNPGGLPQLPQGQANPQIPQFMLDQLQQAQQGPQMTNGSQYGRWNGVNNNAFGLAPSGWPSLYGYQAPQQGAWQPPWGHNGAVGQPLQGGQMPQLPSGQLPQLPKAAQGMGNPPGMDPRNFGQAPQAPQGGPTQQFNFANSVASQSQSPTGQKFLANLSKYGQAGMDKFLNAPQSASVADFNNAARINPTMATQMQAAGGQQFRNAIMGANGWDNYQNNSFLNQYGSGALPGFGG